MRESLSRIRLLIGDKAVEKLQESHVVVAGLGGVGSAAVDTLVRTGVGKMTVIDFDTVAESNINRQVFSSFSRIGMKKADVVKEVLLDINPDVKVNTVFERITKQNLDGILKLKPDVIIDAIDDVQIKIEMVRAARAREIKLVSSMGAALRIDPTKVKIAQLRKTSVCPLAAKMRKALPNDKTVVVYSEEKPHKVATRAQFGSAMTTTATFGLYLAHATMFMLAGTEIGWKEEGLKKQNLY